MYPIIQMYPRFRDTLYISKYGITLSTMYPCIQISSNLRHIYIFSVHHELTYIYLSKCIQGSETHLIFQNRIYFYQPCVHVSKYSVIWGHVCFCSILSIMYYPCIQISSDLRHIYIFVVLHVAKCIIHVSKYPVILDTHMF